MKNNQLDFTTTIKAEDFANAISPNSNSITGLKAQIESIKAGCIDQSTGEFDQKLYEKSREDLILQYAWDIKLRKDEIESYRLREKELKDKRQKLEIQMENERNELESCLFIGEKINGKLAKVSITEKETPVYEDERYIKAFDDRYFEMKAQLNKSVILDDYKKGVKIPGFKMEKKSVLTIR